MSSLAAKVTPTVLMAIGGLHNAAAKHNTHTLCDTLPDLLEQFKISTALRLIHFCAQIAHESDRFNTLTEYASGRAYEGRADLGNVHPGDGRRYRGRGPIQCTGRDNYRHFTKWVRRNFDANAPDFEDHPELLTEVPWAALSAIWYWTTRGLNEHADRDDLRTITKVVNGGYNGLADRAQLVSKARTVFARLAADGITDKQTARLLYRGCTGEDVGALQEDLAKLHYYHLAVDNDFGAGTESAVRALQFDTGQKVDGVVGDMTRSALSQALKTKMAGA